MFTDYDFWFTQPSSTLSSVDQVFGLVFAVLLLVGVVLWIIKRFVRHAVIKKLLGKLVLKDLVVGLSGVVWYGLRYENTPIFGRRIWAGLNVLILAVWLVMFLKYALFKFRKEKREFDDNELKNRYLPGKKR